MQSQLSRPASGLAAQLSLDGAQLRHSPFSARCRSNHCRPVCGECVGGGDICAWQVAYSILFIANPVGYLHLCLLTAHSCGARSAAAAAAAATG